MIALMSEPNIQFLAFEGCPLADAAREALEQALRTVGLQYDEVDLLDPKTPDDLRGWGSPTILINGRDVTGAPKGNSIGCRVYRGPGKVPDAKTIVDRIQEATSG